MKALLLSLLLILDHSPANAQEMETEEVTDNPPRTLPAQAKPAPRTTTRTRTNVSATPTSAVVTQSGGAAAAATDKSTVQAGDTYNFYFQKAPGPTTVNQGTSGAPAPAAAPAPAPVPEEDLGPEIVDHTMSGATEAKAPPPEKKKKHQQFHLGVLYGHMKDGGASTSASGLGVSFQYFFTRMVGVGVGMLFAGGDEEKSPDTTTDYWGFERTESKSTKKSRFDWFTNVTFYPARVELGGGESSIDFGMVAGIMSVTKTTEEKRSHQYQGSTIRFDDEGNTDTKHTADFFVGPSVSVNFSKNIGLLAEARFAPSKAATYLGGVKVMF